MQPEIRRRLVIVPPQITAAAPVPIVALPSPAASAPALSAHPEFLSLPPVLQPPSPVKYAGPRTGRLIWTGSLGKRGVVEIEGAQASIGSLSGLFPGVPLSCTVSPAEFNGTGLTVYSSDRGKAGRKEPPGRDNGWNAMQFLFDPVRARELVVLEEPNPTNDFKRLVVRSDARTCSVVVLDWTVR
jgi:hypothetical protein